MASHCSVLRRPLGFLLFGILASASLGGLQAQTSSPPATSVHFPRFISVADIGSGVAIVNPSAKEAVATLTLTDYTGNPFPLVNNPATVVIPAKGQIAKTAIELFGTFLFIDASLQVTSSTPGLLVHYCTFDSALAFMAGAEPPEASLNLVFPVIPGSAEGAAEIDLLNTNSRPTAVELKLWNFDGELLGQATVQVPSGGSYRNLADAAFPAGTSFSNASHITATSKPPNVFGQSQTVSGTSLFAGFSSVPSGEGDIDIGALNALSLTQASNSGVIPYFRTGERHSSTLSLANLEPAAVNVTLTAVANDGSTVGTRTLSVRSNGGYRAPLQSVFSSLGFSEREGWILVQATGRVAGAVIHGLRDTGSLGAIAMQRTPQFDFAFPQAVQGSGMFSEITLTNSTPHTSFADIYVVSPSGVTLASSQVTISPSRRISQRLDQMFPELVTLPGGFVFVSASEPLFGALSLWTDSGSSVISFAPGLLPSYYSPAVQTRFAVTGTVWLNDRPAPGFRVVLSGPASGIATSGADGRYVFQNLPAGKYSMQMDQFGFQFIPAQVNFEIMNRSRRQDFQGFTSPNAIVVQPGSVPVGSSDVTATVFGKDFNETSEAFIGSVRLATTFVDPTRLRVLLPAYRFASPSTFDVYVLTNPSGPDRRLSNPYPVVAFVNRPVLSSIATDGSIVEGNEGTTVRLGGTGFLPGAKVMVNGSGDGIEISLLSSTEIVMFLPASYLAQGGIYPVTVENPYPANIESNIQLLTVFYPAPSVQDISPRVTPVRLEQGSGALNMDILGFGFRRGAVVLFNGVPLNTTYCENDSFCLAVHMYAKVPASFLRQSGFAEIRVKNPDPSLGASEAVYLMIQGLQPTVTSVIPGSAAVLDTPFSFSMPVVINGTNFGPQTQVRVYHSSEPEPPAFSAPNTILSSTQLVKNITVQYPDALGEWIVEVANPQPGGGYSEPASFTITEGNFAGNPFLVSLSPQVVAVGGPSFTLSVNGTNFVPGARINFYSSPLVTTFISDRQLQAEVPASLIRFAGRVPVSVTNPDTGGTSNRLYLDIR